MFFQLRCGFLLALSLCEFRKHHGKAVRTKEATTITKPITATIPQPLSGKRTDKAKALRFPCCDSFPLCCSRWLFALSES